MKNMGLCLFTFEFILQIGSIQYPPVITEKSERIFEWKRGQDPISFEMFSNQKIEIISLGKVGDNCRAYYM